MARSASPVLRARPALEGLSGPSGPQGLSGTPGPQGLSGPSGPTGPGFIQWSGLVNNGIPGDCNNGDGCNYAPVISASQFTARYVYCAIGQNPYNVGGPPTFVIYYGSTTPGETEQLWQLGACTPTQRFGAGSYYGVSGLNARLLVPGSVLLIAPVGYNAGMKGYPVTVTITP